MVDGGSLDGTAELLAAAERPGLKWISEPDRGQSDALNKGLGLASGDIQLWPIRSKAEQDD
jgi:glycosyltransferase involved in cell wall biosynthesis